MLLTLLTGATAGRLADLESINQDLSFAADVLQRYAALPSPDEPEYDLVLQRSLWNAAVVSYARPFTSSKGFLRPGAPRTRIQHLVDQLTAEERATHALVLDHRNSHVAHSVGKQEGVVVFACFLPSELGATFDGVQLLHHTHNGDPLIALKQIVVIEHLLELLATEVEAAWDVLLEECRSNEERLRTAAEARPTIDAGAARPPGRRRNG